MHYFDPARPRDIRGRPMYQWNGKPIAPFPNFSIEPVEFPSDDMTEQEKSAYLSDPHGMVNLMAFWVYELHIATGYSLALQAADLAPWWQVWLSDPELQMRQSFRNGRGAGWSFSLASSISGKPGLTTVLKPKAKGGVSIDIEDLFG